MFLTYDLPQSTSTGSQASEPVIRSARDLNIPGRLLRWSVGEFENPSGVKSYGVRVEYADPRLGHIWQFFEVPANATQVEVHERELPPQYRSALRSAA